MRQLPRRAHRVNTRQKKMNADYHAEAKSLDARGGDMHGGFDPELNSYGQAGRVIGPVVGAFGETSSDVHVIAKAVAEELALEHCCFYGDKTLKVVKVFFSQPALPILGTYGPPRMGAPSSGPTGQPVPCAGSQCALPSSQSLDSLKNWRFSRDGGGRPWGLACRRVDSLPA